MDGPFIAVDWGTTNRRAWRIGASGAVESEEQDGRGILSLEPGGFAAEAAALRARLGDLPMLCAGMAGSDRGWAETAYLSCPLGLDAVAAALLWVEPGRTAILPGAAMRGERPDVMRGEEVQALGAAAADLVPPHAFLCLPGTHCKWVVMKDGRLERFLTAMTGELFALLRDHSLLAPLLAGPVAPGPAFLDGIGVSDADLPVRLFEIRAASLLGRRDDSDAASYASGLLIGADVRASGCADREVHVLGEPPLAALYGAAIQASLGRPVAVDARAAFLAGIAAIWRMM